MAFLLLLFAVLPGEPPTFLVRSVDEHWEYLSGGRLGALDAQQLTLLCESSSPKGWEPKVFKLSEVRSVELQSSVVISGGGTIQAAHINIGGPPGPLDAAAVEAAKKAAVWVETVDGSHFPAASYQVSRGIATVGLPSGDAIKVPVKAIDFVEFRAAGRDRASWKMADTKADVAADLIVVRKGDSIDFVEGSAGDINDETVNFNVDNDSVPVKRSKVAGIIYFHPDNDRPLPAATCTVSDIGGARLQAKSVKLAEGRLQIEATFGTVVPWPLESLSMLDFSPSLMTYLSDLPANSTEFTPFLDFGEHAASMTKYYQPQRDRCFDGGPLHLKGDVYAKGLSIRSRTAMSFRIAGKGKRFKALAGIDDSVHGAGNVRLQVSGDGKTLYDGKITGHDKAVALDLDVADVRRLSILVDFNEGLDVGNYLDLCDARIVK